MTDSQYPTEGIRRLITGSVMAATVMNSLDSTIANVALPHMQGSVSASQDQITWVLTSYIVAAAIMTPLTGWLAGNFGRKRLMLYSIVGFTIASGLCGLATSLFELVGFRLLQGIFGAALVPMSQAILLDINPPERHGPAMAVWGMGAILGPIIGPALGGYLTDTYSWRWVFYINLPVGMLAFAGLWFFLSETKNAQRIKLDLFGFAMLALGIASLQMMLDRGQQLDWFHSLEICIEGTASVTFFYLFIVPHAHRAQSVHRSRLVQGSQLPVRLGLRLFPRRDDLRGAGAPAADAGGTDGLSGGADRAGHRTARRGHDDLDDRGGAIDQARRRSHPDRHRNGVRRLFDLPDERLLAWHG